MDKGRKNMADSTDDEIIELTQMVEEDIPETGEILELAEMAGEEEPLVMEDAAMDGGTSGADLSMAERDDLPGINPDTISQEQLDAAVERVIEKKFAQHIEKILFEVTETIIKREIAEIKAGLQKDLDDIDNA